MFRSRRVGAVAFIFCLVASCAVAFGQRPVITALPTIGSTLITGAGTPGAKVFICMAITAAPTPPCNSVSPFPEGLSGGKAFEQVGADGTFKVNLASQLGSGKYVYATQVVTTPAATTVSLAVPVVVKPHVYGSLIAGAPSVIGYGQPGSKIYVCKTTTPPPSTLPDCSIEEMLPLTSPSPFVVAAPDGSFAAGLVKGVTAGNSFYLAQVTDGYSAIFSTPISVGSSTAKLSILSPLSAGTSEIKGIADPLGTIYVCITEKAPTSPPQDCSTGLMAPIANPSGVGPNVSSVSGAGGGFDAKVATPLAGGSFVYVAQVIEGSPTTFSQPVSVSASTASLSILGPLLGGATSITGIADANGRIFVCVSSGAPASPPPDCSATGNALPLIGGAGPSWIMPSVAAQGAIGNAHSFTAKFAPGLTAGSSVYLTQIIPNNPATFSAVVTVQSLSHEREHTDFVGGTLLSADGSNYSQGNVFLALNYDRALYRPGYYSEHMTRHPGLNFFFQGRLTTIPVNASQTVTSPATGTATGTAANTTTAPTAASFLAAQKAAQFSGGGYMPFLFGKSPNSLLVRSMFKNSTFYIGPVAAFGFSTPSGSPSGSSSTSTAAGTITTTTTALATTSSASNQLYNYWFAGGRIATADIEPGSIHTRHYFDIGIGKYSNLQSLVCNAKKAPANDPGCLTQFTTKPTVATDCVTLTATSGTTTTTTYNCSPINPAFESRTTLYRLAFEGYLEIPSTNGTSFILGMSANTAMTAFSRRANLDSSNKAPEDIEFLIAYKFDINKLLSSVKLIGQGQ